MSTYTLEFEDGTREYLHAVGISQARFAADAIAKGSTQGLKLRAATIDEEKALVASHSLPQGPE